MAIEKDLLDQLLAGLGLIRRMCSTGVNPRLAKRSRRRPDGMRRPARR